MARHEWETERGHLRRVVTEAENSNEYVVRHKCFLSYAAADIEQVSHFVEQYGATFIPRVVGVSEDDPFVDSDDDDYVLAQIQSRYLWDSTVTILLIGECTWSRRFVDWEIYSTLRDGSVNRKNGLVAVQLPSVDGATPSLPGRFADNYSYEGDSYARYYRYPQYEATLRTQIQAAFDSRSTLDHLIDNSRLRRKVNSAC